VDSKQFDKKRAPGADCRNLEGGYCPYREAGGVRHRCVTHKTCRYGTETGGYTKVRRGVNQWILREWRPYHNGHRQVSGSRRVLARNGGKANHKKVTVRQNLSGDIMRVRGRGEECSSTKGRETTETKQEEGAEGDLWKKEKTKQ